MIADTDTAGFTPDRPYPLLDQVRVGLVGYGAAFNIARLHGQTMEATGKMHVVGVCDTDPERAQAGETDFEQAKGFTSLDELLATVELDLAVICLPHNLHAPAAIQCSEAGLHVVTEKPMCLTVDEADRMIAAARDHQAMLSVFHNRRWDGDFLALKAIIAKGLLGRIFHVEMYGGGYSKPGPWWRSRKEISGGLFYDWGAHYLDWLLQIMGGPITGVTGFFHKLKWHESSNEDNVEAAIRFRSGAVAHVQWSSLAMVGKERWRILGTEGALLSGNDRFTVKTQVQDYPATLEVKHQDSDWGAYYRNVAAHLTEGTPLAVKPEEARRVIAVIETAEKSSEAGHTLEVPGEPTGR